MDILKGCEVWDQLIKKYDKKPLQWHEVEYVTPRGYYDLLLFSPDYAAFIKQDTAYSANPIVIGLWIEEPEFHKIIFSDKTTAAMVLRMSPYGMRNVSINPVIKKIKKMIDEERNPAEIFNSAIGMFIRAREGARRTSPVSFRDGGDAVVVDVETREGMITIGLLDSMTGPRIPVPLDVLSKKHRKLVERLDNELTSMIHRKYSMYV